MGKREKEAGKLLQRQMAGDAGTVGRPPLCHADPLPGVRGAGLQVRLCCPCDLHAWPLVCPLWSGHGPEDALCPCSRAHRAHRPRCPRLRVDPSCSVVPFPEGCPEGHQHRPQASLVGSAQLPSGRLPETPALPGTRPGCRSSAMSPKEDAAPKPSPAEARRPALSCGAELPPVLWPRAPLCPVPSEAWAGRVRQATLSPQDGGAPVPHGTSVGAFIQWDPNLSWGQKTWVCQGNEGLRSSLAENCRPEGPVVALSPLTCPVASGRGRSSETGQPIGQGDLG